MSPPVGLDYLGARYYSGGQGRFTSVDPENRSGAVPDPQSWNGYSYARNNPLRYTDPDGEVYQICVPDEQGKNQCTSVSDEEFGQLRQNPGSGISLSNGDINAFVNGQWVKAGTYWQTDVDLPMGVSLALRAAGQTADREVKAFARDVAINVGLGVVGGVFIEGTTAAARLLPFKDARLLQRVNNILDELSTGRRSFAKARVFENDGRAASQFLPSQAPGYYREFTVQPAAGAGRGAERLVVGQGGEVYYTPNHYGSFVRIQ